LIEIIKLIYNVETLAYSIKKAKILKITYASGSAEVYNKPKLSTSSATDLPDFTNTTGSFADYDIKIAVCVILNGLT